jgi:hypothetical protein
LADLQQIAISGLERSYSPIEGKVDRFATDCLSTLGHKQTFAAQKAMSVLPPKADMCRATRHVRFTPTSGHWQPYVAGTSEIMKEIIARQIILD